MTLEDALQSFAQGMLQASALISQKRPDFIIAPMMGSVPLVDALYAVDPNFDPNLVYYMPASSHLPDVNNIIQDWLDNFFAQNIGPEYPVSVLVIDEVVSGGSAERVNRALQRAATKRRKALTSDTLRAFWTSDPNQLRDAAANLDRLTDSHYHNFFSELVARHTYNNHGDGMSSFTEERNELMRIARTYFQNHINAWGIGVEDLKSGAYEHRPRNKEYSERVRGGEILPVTVQTILTLDNPTYCPVRYISWGNSEKSHVRFQPVLDPNPVVTDEYVTFLRKLSELT